MAHSEAGPAARLPRSAGGIVTIIAGAAGTTLVALDMATSGDPHAAEWLVLLLPVFPGLGLLAAAPAMLAFRLRADSRWAQSGALAGSLAILVNVVSSTCPNLLYRLGGEQVAAVLAPLFPTVPAPLLAAGAGLVLAGVFSYLNRYAWVASVGLGLLAVLAASQVPVVDGPVLLLALDGPLLAGAVRGPDPVHPRKQNHRGGAESVRRAHPLLTEFKSGTARPGQSRQCARRDRGGRSLRPLADSDAARPGAGKPPIVLVIVEALQRTRPPSMRERLYVDARRSFRPSASLFSARSAASTADSTRPSPARTRHPLDNVTPIGVEGAASNDRPYSDAKPASATSITASLLDSI